jgi:uroporphyrin-III C-methyltransferase
VNCFLELKAADNYWWVYLMTKKTGTVSLVGAGPGDAELLTIKALRLLENSDVVVYDRLVSAEILDLIPHGVSKILVGKSVGKHCVPQRQINDMIIGLAKAGRHVVRLKGGDPFLFGRGGEEALALKRCNIQFEIVPGITAASGCSAYSGIPLTFRGLSRSVRFLTGHLNDNEPLDMDWQSIAEADTTLVIYMGLGNLPLISASLIEAGLDPLTPAAAIKNGTTKRQQSVFSNLVELPDVVSKNYFEAPVMIIIGKVVSLAKDLDWFQAAAEESDYDKNIVASC